MNSRPWIAALAVPLLVSIASTALIAGCGSSGSTPSGTGGASSGSGGAGSGGNVGSGGSASGGSSSGGAVGSGGSASGGSGSGGSASGGSGSGGSGSGGSSTGGSSSGGSGGSGGGAVGSGGSAGAPAAGGRGGSDGSAGRGAAGGSSGGGGAGSFVITTPAFMAMAGCGPAPANTMCPTWPKDNTNFGTNVSPEMTWSGAPAGTMSYAVVLQDLTNTYAHWVLWNIPPSVTENTPTLAANIPKTSAMPAMPAGSQQCSLGTGDGYFGPGACGNVYELVVYALGVAKFSPTNATDPQMVRSQLQALTSILGTASIRARTFMPNCP